MLQPRQPRSPISTRFTVLAPASTLSKPNAARGWSVTCRLQRRDKDTYPVASRGGGS